MTAQLCICNNCNAIMVDENPSKQPEFEIPNNITDMVFISDEDMFWACPNCETDEYLTDVTELSQLA